MTIVDLTLGTHVRTGTTAGRTPIYWKSSKMPWAVAIALSEQNGGSASLTAVLAIVAGILGAVVGPRTLTLLRVRDQRVRGLALGVASHGIGTARMLQESRVEGAFSALAMALSAVALPLLPVLQGMGG